MLRKARFGPRLGPPMIGGFPVPTATDAMLPALLLLILTGSFVTATAMAVQGASWAAGPGCFWACRWRCWRRAGCKPPIPTEAAAVARIPAVAPPLVLPVRAPLIRPRRIVGNGWTFFWWGRACRAP